MELIEIASVIGKWSQSNDNTVGRIQESDKPRFGLKAYSPTDRSLFIIKNNIYVTNIDTDYILDINIDTGLRFDVDGHIPTVDDLYQAYLKVKENEEKELSRAKDGLDDIWFRLNVSSTRTPFRRTLESISNELKEVLLIAYPFN